MSMSTNLNVLVEAGKQDVASLFRHNPIQGAAGAARQLPSLFFLAMSKSEPQLDIMRARAMIIQENEAVLADADQNAMLDAMARAAGRIAKMQQYLHAVERLRLTAPVNEDVFHEIDKLERFLKNLEKASVRFVRDANGGVSIMNMREIFAAACDLSSQEGDLA